MENFCKICNKKYSSYQSLWIHNKKYHNGNKEQNEHKNTPEQNKNYECEYCNNFFSFYQSKWRHEKICKKKNLTLEIVNKIEKIEKEMQLLKTEPKINNITNINKGVINNFFSKPGSESIDSLSESAIEYILDQELNSVIRLIEMLNFSTNIPENHTFCSTALNDKHINVINPETTQIEKRIKKEFIEQLLAPGIENVKKLYERMDPKNPKRQKYNEKIERLINSIIINNKGKKVFVDAINVLTYNNRHKVMSTWEQIKKGKIPDTKNIQEDDIKPAGKVKNLLNINNEYSDSEFSDSTEQIESDSETETELLKIEYKNKFYYLDNNLLYEIVNNKKAKLFAHYKNGRVIIIKEKEIEIEV